MWGTVSTFLTYVAAVGTGTTTTSSVPGTAGKKNGVEQLSGLSQKGARNEANHFGVVPLVTQDWDCRSVLLKVRENFSWEKYRYWLLRILKSDSFLLANGKFQLEFFPDWVAILHSWENLLDDCPLGVTASVFLFYLWRQWGLYDRERQAVILKKKRHRALRDSKGGNCGPEESVSIVNGTETCLRVTNGTSKKSSNPQANAEVLDASVPLFLADSTAESAVVEFLSYLLHQKNVDFVTLAGTAWPIFALLCELDVSTDATLKERIPILASAQLSASEGDKNPIEGQKKNRSEMWIPDAIPKLTNNRKISTDRECDYIGSYSSQYLQRKLEQFIGFSKSSPITEAWLFLRDLDPIMAGLLRDIGFGSDTKGGTGFLDTATMVKKLKLDACPAVALAVAGVMCILSYLAAPQNFEYFSEIANIVLQYRVAELFSSGFADTQKWNVFFILKSLSTFKNREYRGDFDSTLDLIDYNVQESTTSKIVGPTKFPDGIRTRLHQRKTTEAFVHDIRKGNTEKMYVMHLTAVGGDEYSQYLPAYAKRFFRELRMRNLGIACLDESVYNSCKMLGQQYRGLLCLDAVGFDVVFGKHKWIPIFLAMGLAVLWLDFDVYLFRDPAQAILGTHDVNEYLAAPQSYDVDIWVQEHYDGLCLNSGVFFVVPSHKSVAFFVEFLRWIYQSVFSDNQNGFDAFLGHSIRESFVPPMVRGSLKYKLLDVEHQFISAEGHYVASDALTVEEGVVSKDWDKVVLFHFWQSDYEGPEKVETKAAPNDEVKQDIDYDDENFPEDEQKSRGEKQETKSVTNSSAAVIVNEVSKDVFGTKRLARPKLRKGDLFAAFYGTSKEPGFASSKIREEILKFQWGPRPKKPSACSILTAGSQTIFAARNPHVNLSWTIPDPAATKREQDLEQGMELVFKSMMDDGEEDT